MTEFNQVLPQYTKLPDLFSLLSLYRVVIPGIQRHYVQGADNPRATAVRTNFITSLFAAFENNQTPVHLHFVYGPIGTNGEDSFTPVDGQQRLTTLWLLARYAAEYLDNIHEKNSVLQLLSRFSYTDRIHAKRFCQALIEDKSSWQTGEDPMESIPRQSWFWDYWQQDETVAAMLRMLSTIHKQWRNKENLEPNNFLIFLAEKVTFSLQIDTFADDIYMKMNARGLQLTQWENFKGKFAELLSNEKTKWNEDIEALSNAYFNLANQQLPDNAFFALAARLAVYSAPIAPANNGAASVGQIAKLAYFTNWNAELPYVPFEEFSKILPKNRDDFAKKYLGLVNFILNQDDGKIARSASPYWQTGRTLLQSVFQPQNQNELDLSWILFSYCHQNSQQTVNAEDFAKALRCMWNILENVSRDTKNPFERIKKFDADFIQNGGPSLYALPEEPAIPHEAIQWREEYVKASIYAEKDAGHIGLLQTAEANMHGRVRLGILNLASENSPEINFERLEKLNELFSAWRAGGKGEIRKNIVLNIVAAEPYKLKDAISLSTQDNDLLALLTTRDDCSLQEHLLKMGTDEMPAEPYSKRDDLPSWTRDWRAIILKIAHNSDGYGKYSERLWKGMVRWHGATGVYALYCNSQIHGALPINDWRSDPCLEECYRPLGDDFKDITPNDCGSHSGVIDLGNEQTIRIYFWKDKVTVWPDHSVLYDIGNGESLEEAEKIKCKLRGLLNSKQSAEKAKGV